MRLRWFRTKKESDTVGVIYLEVHAGRFHLQAQAPIASQIVVKGESLDDLEYDIDYKKARKDVARALRDLAHDCEHNSELIEVFEAGEG